ncbi:hypothetical protein AWM75_00445 [Aerococcus urinaehominis]|uniref:Pyruvate kinase n=1 Tax=Aerococcus urinaehominis TaxID=128944 RepID=A0A0X8FJP0_9LACT|nr:pyruvate kinase [Aerococcus urinaehominis]AMB98552.1 hypothetical protein AWM75_00445 [Aerococcus urinaehominis]SDL78337.1 pyruvate kinase [Aerococcus urinaehominis]
MLGLLEELEKIRLEVYKQGQEYYRSWSPTDIRPDYRDSAQNLAYYRALRQIDLVSLQESLLAYGLNPFVNIESDVLAGLDQAINHLAAMQENGKQADEPAPANKPDKLLAQRQLDFYGQSDQAAIMVTMPPNAVDDLQLIADMQAAGMTVARINTAHENIADWQAMVANLHQNQANLPVYFDTAGPKVRISALYTRLQNPKLVKGDQFFISYREELGPFQDQDLVLTCPYEDLIKSLAVGDQVVMYDGDVSGQVTSCHPAGVVVTVTGVRKEKGQKIKATKGINFPEKDLGLDILSPDDQAAIAGIARADLATGFNLSYLRQTDDLIAIKACLAKNYGQASQDLKLNLKIETQAALDNIYELIIEGNRHHQAGLMIARGDLAAELGFVAMASLQEELLRLGRAGHIPVVLATQVLDNLVKTGIPSRAEISDVMLAGRSQCVMLNKGPYISRGIATLKRLLTASNHYFNHQVPYMGLSPLGHQLK